jgi:hypothetical protein
LTTGGVFLLMNFLCAVSAFGQLLHPFEMLSGVKSLVGPGTTSLVGAPATRFVILTDISFTAQLSPGDMCEVVLSIEGVNSGLRARATQLINLPASAPNRVFHINYSGYLYEITPGAVGGQTPSVPPSHLGQNVPNPFNPTTSITYSLSMADNVKLRFFDSQGRVVRTLIDGRKDAGEHTVTWDGRNDSGQPLPSGVYYYELGGNVAKESRKAILLK